MIANSAVWLDAQISVLGSVMLDAKWAGQVCSRTSAEDYSEDLRPVYWAIARKFQAGEPIDPVTVSAALGPDSKQLIADIMTATPTAATCGEYIDLVLEQRRLLDLYDLADELKLAHTMDAAREVLEKANQLAIQREKVRIISMQDALRDFYDRQNGEKKDYLSWGIAPLDENLYVEAGDLVVLGGYPSAGKTALALSMAFHQGRTQRVGFFSFETTDRKLFDRLIPTLTKIDFGQIKKHDLAEYDWEVLAKKGGEITGNRLELIPAAGMTVSDIKAAAIYRDFGVVYLDYMQLIRPTDPRRSGFEQVTQISMDLHSFAQTSGVTVVALSQLSRPQTTAGSKKQLRPSMHSLRQSGQIEQDADVIMFVYKDLEEAKTTADREKHRRQLDIAKNKEGECRSTILAFDGATQTFKVDENEVWRRKRRQQQSEQRAAKREEKERAAMGNPKFEELGEQIKLPEGWEDKHEQKQSL